MSTPFTPDQQQAFFDIVWKRVDPTSGRSSATCPNDNYRMKAFALKEERARADIAVDCPRCGRMVLGADLDPRLPEFREWTDDEKQEMVDRHFQGGPVNCPIDGTPIRPSPLGDRVFLQCWRCGKDHWGDIHQRIGTKALSPAPESPVRTSILQAFLNTPELPRSEAIMTWDLFISHAWEDKTDVADPLATMLEGRGLKVWYDKNVLRIGDRLRRKIDEGLANSRYGLVILSPHFFAKDWPQKELDALAALETAKSHKILPVWHKVGQEEVARFSPMLAGVVGVPTAGGLENIVEQVMAVVRPGGHAGDKPAAPPHSLPAEAVVLLKEAASSPSGRILAIDSPEGFEVQAGNFEFNDPDKVRMAARYEAVIRKLREEYYIREIHDGLHELTDKGYEFVESLA